MHGRRFLLISIYLKKNMDQNRARHLVFHHQPQFRGSLHCCFSEYVLKITTDLFVNHGNLGLNPKLGLLLLFPSVENLAFCLHSLNSLLFRQTASHVPLQTWAYLGPPTIRWLMKLGHINIYTKHTPTIRWLTNILNIY